MSRTIFTPASPRQRFQFPTAAPGILRHTRYVAFLMLLIAGVGFAHSVQAATITVNSLGDTLNNADGVCSIREAIINANNDAATWSNCAAGSGADTINLPAGTITLSIPNGPDSFTMEQLSLTGDLDITSNMTINGNAAGTTINGAALDRIFDVNPDTDFDPITSTPLIVVDINNLTITNGRQNDTGALLVQLNATVTVDNSTVSNSRSWANDAGGVGNNGTLTMTNCTISGNTCLLVAGGIRNDGTLTLISCTVTNNDSDFNNLNGGVSNSSGTTTLRNTIVAGNGGVDEPNLRGSFISTGYNLIGDFGTNLPTIVATTGDQFDVSDATVQLGALASNGGPTPTHALGAGSIAIDQGHSSGTTTDQRGETRPCDDPGITNATLGDGSDVGAFEVQGVCAVELPPDAVDDNVSVAEDSGANIINVLANDSDPNMDPLVITAVSAAATGSVINNGNSVTYTPNDDFCGSDSFTYTITDGNANFDTATVNVTVDCVNDPPIANNDSYNINQDTTLTVSAPGVLDNDTDVDDVSFTAVYDLGNGPNHGVLTLNADGSFEYEPDPGFTGMDTFNYHADDGTDDSNVATVTITINDTQAPVIECSVETALLWPPNSDLVNVGFNVTATDNDGLPPVMVIDVFSDEDDQTDSGSGVMSPDARDIANETLRLRAERRGDSDGRVYIIRITATDSSDNTSVHYCTVVVPHGKSTASINDVNAQAAAGVVAFIANGNNPPAGFFVVGDGPTIGSKQ